MEKKLKLLEVIVNAVHKLIKIKIGLDGNLSHNIQGNQPCMLCDSH